MDKDEEKLIKRFGKVEPFKVPDGYFEDFTRQLMTKLPDKSHKTGIVELRPKLWSSRLRGGIAAAVIAVTLTIGIYTYIGKFNVINSYDRASMPQKENLDQSKASFDQMADYTMMDNEDIYASLVDNK
ncbi:MULTISPECIES: hypothetical protein [Prevotella]|uniref:Anti-sigma factor n=1 Tax=Prevotella herbatica TaxID=2801997 RepID=A0ABN6EE25_9BACT|nr:MULTISPECIES: hypothetical protein [Prevotella]MDN5553178.1 hypothetical protein [Prevotella sp.]BCS84197.1 hypothetical protein prwr041_00900 [Prevotella herbatica]